MIRPSILRRDAVHTFTKFAIATLVLFAALMAVLYFRRPIRAPMSAARFAGSRQNRF